LKATKLRHVGIVVEDITKTVITFKKLFGLKVKSNIIKSSGPYISNLIGFKRAVIKTAILKIEDDNRIEIIEYVKPKMLKKKISPNNLGVSHIALTVSSMKKFVNKAKKFKIKLIGEPKLNTDRSVKVVYAIINNEIICEVVEVLNGKAKYSGGK
jgi:hypothetical protein